MKPGMISVAAISRYGARCPEFREAWHQVQSMIDVGQYDVVRLAELVDYVIDMTEEEKKIKQIRKESAK